MTELQEKIESFENLLIEIATSGNRPEEEGNFKQLRTELIGNNEIKNQLPDFVKTNRTVAQFWQYIKGRFSTYKERRDFIWAEFAKALDYIEAKQNDIIDNVKTSSQAETMKDKLIKILEKQKQVGDSFSHKIESVSNMKELDEFLKEYDDWNNVNTNILDKAYVHRQLFQMYSGAANYLGNVHIDKNSFQGKRDRVLYCLPKQLAHLKTAIAQTQSLRNTDLLPIGNQLKTFEQQQNKTQKNMSKLFISHSSADKEKIKPLIDLIENIGVSHNQIFFSSHPALELTVDRTYLKDLKRNLKTMFLLFSF